MNIEFNPEELKNLSTNTMKTCGEILIDELASRYSATVRADEKQEITSTILKLK